MKLKRSIGLVGLSFVAFSGMMGSGWLFAPLLTSRLAGPAAIISWLIGGVAMLMLAICFAEVIGLLPVAGGIARLPHFTHGDVTSSVLGWSAWVGYNTTAPIETIAMLEYLSPRFPWLFSGASADGDLSAAGSAVVAVILAVFVVINAFGAAAFTRVNSLITWVKLLVPVTVGVAIVSARFEPANFTSMGFAPSGTRGIFAAVSSGGIIFALIGFRHAIDMAGEVKRPRVTIPLALTLALVACVGLYLLLQVAFIGALSADDLKRGWANLEFQHNVGPIAAVAAGLGIVWLSATIYTGAIVAPLGGGLVVTGSMARLGYALSQNGFFPRAIEKLSDRGVPLRSLVMNFFFGVAVVLFVPFDEAVAVNGAAITLSFSAGPLALYALRKQMPDAPRRFRVPAAPVVSALGFVVATLIVYWSGWNTTWRLGLVVLVGILFFAVKMRRDGVSLAELDLRQAFWLLPYGLGIAVLSYIGDFGGGREVLVYPWDLVMVSGFGLAVFLMANRCRLPDATAARYREKYATLPDPDTVPL